MPFDPANYEGQDRLGHIEKYLAQTLAQLPNATSNVIWSMGDSLILRNSTVSPPIFNDTSPLSWAALLSNSRLRVGGIGASGGQTSSQILTSHLPTVLRASPGFCLICMGTNDPAAGLTLATSIANWVTAIQQMLAAGIMPVLCTIPPKATQQQPIGQINQWIRRYGSLHGLPVVDWHTNLVNTTNGQLSGTYDSGDGVHQNAAGGKVMGGLVADKLCGTTNVVATTQGAVVAPWDPPLADYGADLSLMLSNALLLIDTNADGIPDNWALSAGSGATVGLAGDAAVLGNAWSITRGAADLTYVSNTISASAGDVIACGMWVNFAPAASGTCDVRLRTNSATILVQFPGNFATAFGWQKTWFEVTMPSDGSTGVLFQLQVKTGAASVLKIAQPTLVNLTSNGLT